MYIKINKLIGISDQKFCHLDNVHRILVTIFSFCLFHTYAHIQTYYYYYTIQSDRVNENTCETIQPCCFVWFISIFIVMSSTQINFTHCLSLLPRSFDMTNEHFQNADKFQVLRNFGLWESQSSMGATRFSPGLVFPLANQN